MICYNVPYWRARQAELARGAPIVGEAATRQSGPRTATRPRTASLGAAMLLHLAVAWLLLSYVRLRSTPAALDDQTVALIFAPAPAPHAAPPSVPTVAAVTPIQPPEPPAPPDPPVLAAIPPTPPDTPLPTETPPLLETPSPTAAPPLPAIPPPPPTTTALTPRVPPPPPPPRRPAPKPRATTPPRTAIATSSRPPPSAPAQETPPPTAAPAAQPDAVATTTAPAAPPAPIATDWQRELSGWLAAHKTYPDAARQRGEQGPVVLRFTVDRSGKVLEVTLVSGSGSPRLDDAAQAMLRNASLPPFPAQMPQERVTATVQIRYRLTD
jgi:protein TonB